MTDRATLMKETSAQEIGLLPEEGSRRDRAIMGLFNGVTKLRSELRRS